MRNAKKTLSLVMVAIFTTFIVLSGIPAGAVTSAQAKAQVTKATAAVVKVEKTVKVASFNPTTATTQLTAANKEVAKVKSLGTAYKKNYTALAARTSAVAKKITARKAAILAAAKKVYTDAEAAVTAAENATDGDKVDLVGDETALANAQSAVTTALEMIVKLNQDSSDYKGLMARIDAANNLIVKAMDEIAEAAAQKAIDDKLKADAEAAAKALEAAIKVAETDVAALEAAPVTTLAEIDAALALGVKAAASVKAIANAEKEAPFAARIKVVADKGLTAKAVIEAKAKADAEAKKPATMLSVNAVDGTLSVTFDKKAVTTPVAADFTVTKAVDGAAATAVTGVTVNVVSDTAVTLVVPATVKTTKEQSVVYSVAYTTGAAITASAYKVALDPALVAKEAAEAEAKIPATIVSVSAVDGTITVTFTKKPITTPAAVQFVVTKTVTTTSAVTTTVAAGDVKLAVVSDTAITLTVPTVAAITGVDQTVLYSVVYNATGAAVAAKAAFAVAKIPAFEVASVAALNAKQVEVVFNKEVDATLGATAANYTVGGVVFGTATVQADKKTVVLTLAGETKMTNAGTADIKVLKAVKDAAGNALAADYAKTITITDMKLPSVTKVEATGLKTIKITFDEPVYDATGTTTLQNDQITVKSGIYTYTVTTAKADYATRTITLTTGTALLAGDVVVKINAPGMTDAQAIRDFAGLTALTQDVTFKYAIDTTVATATLSVSKETKKATVTFSKPVYGANVTLYHSVNGVAAYGTAAIGKSELNAATEWEFTFTNSIPSGALTFYLANSTTAADQLTDLFGVKIPSQSFNYTVVADTVAPTVSTVTVNANTSIDVAFSEAADATELVNAANYEILKADGTKLSFSTSVVDTKTVRLAATLEDNTTYTVNVKAMKDAAGVAMASAYMVQKTVGDNLNPTATAYATSANTIYISYSENMNESDITNKANYLVDANDDGTYAPLGTDDTVTLVSAKKVKITWAAADFTGGVDRVQIGAVRDLAGKKLTNDNVFSTLIDNVAGDTLTYTASVVALNKVKLTFNKVVTSFDNAEFTVVGSTVQQIESITTNSDGVTEVVLVLDASIAAGATPAVTTVVTPANTKSTEATVLLGAQNVTSVDKVAPTFTVEFINATTIHVIFNKNIEADTVSTIGMNGFSVNGGTLTKAAMVTPGTDGTIIVLTGTDFTSNTDVTYTAGYIADNTVSANKVVSKTVTDALLSDANTKLIAFETAALLDLTVDANYTAAGVAKTAADTAIALLPAGATKTAFDARATVSSGYYAAANTAEALVALAETACATAVSTTNKANIDLAETAITNVTGNAAYTTNSNVLTKAAMVARMTTAKASVVADTGFTFTVIKTAPAVVKYVFAGSDITAGMTTGYTQVSVLTSGVHANATTLAYSATGTVTITDGGVDTNGVAVITTTVTNTFWGKTATFVTDVTDAAGADTIVVR